MEGHYTTAEAGAKIGVDESQVRRYIRAGLLTHIKIGEGLRAVYLIPKDAVATFTPPAVGRPSQKSKKKPRKRR
jgi:hypothetical protein